MFASCLLVKSAFAVGYKNTFYGPGVVWNLILKLCLFQAENGREWNLLGSYMVLEQKDRS